MGHLTVDDAVTANRKAVVAYLRENPGGFNKITGIVADDGDGRCLIGIVSEATGRPLSGLDFREVNESSYEYAEKAVGTPSTSLWSLNDRGSFTADIRSSRKPSFEEMADYLETEWGLAVPVPESNLS